MTVNYRGRPVNVFFFHERAYLWPNTGRRTFAVVPHSVEDGTLELHVGISECSDKDSFNRRVGRGIALTRAMSEPRSVHSHEFVQTAYMPFVPELADTPLPRRILEVLKRDYGFRGRE